MSALRSHPEVEFATDRPARDSAVHHASWADACVRALNIAAAEGEAIIDVLIFGPEGAKAWGGDDAVEEYEEDPEASVFQRLRVRVCDEGRVP